MAGVRHYLNDIKEGISSSFQGLKLTLRHLLSARNRTKQTSIASSDYFSQTQGIVTLEYPYEAIPVPDNGRYRLHNEIDDCIVCDKCAKICPVDCIEIEAIKSTEEIGLTSDGTSKRLYASKFDIDMAKCCYCGLCTTVCPTECLTMTPTFDYSEFDIRDMNYHFTDLSPEEAEEKQRLYDQKQAEKAAAKLAPPKPAVATPERAETENSTGEASPPKPAFKPKFTSPKEPSICNPEEAKENAPPSGEAENKPKPVFKPRMPVTKPQTDTTEEIRKSTQEVGETSLTAPSDQTISEPANKPKPVFKPKILVKNPEANENSGTASETSAPVSESNTLTTEASNEAPKTSPKPVFRPKIPVKKAEEPTQSIEPFTNPIEPPVSESQASQERVAPNPVFRPKIPVKKVETPLPAEDLPPSTANPADSAEAKLPEEQPSSEATAPKPKPVFKPKMKPIIPPKPSEEKSPDDN